MTVTQGMRDRARDWKAAHPKADTVADYKRRQAEKALRSPQRDGSVKR